MSDEMDMTPADVLRAAADELLVTGWKQHDYGFDDCQKCVMGAIRFALWGSVTRPEDNPARSFGAWDLIKACEQRLMADGCGWTLLDQWNDSAQRTRDDVIRLLLIVADDLEGAHASP